MKHTDYFDNFLKNTVNLSQFNLDTLEGRVESIYGALKADPDLGPRIIKKIPQGSWAQRTIISPQNGKAFDADVMLQMKEEPDWSDNVKQYIAALYKVIHNHSTYGKMPHNKKCRCVYIEYANNAMHVDIVPFVIL
ncbi:MAG: SMODS domain-containing nucleotidyltransferase, partial [Micromonosporaceae bacterium]